LLSDISESNPHIDPNPKTDPNTKAVTLTLSNCFGMVQIKSANSVKTELIKRLKPYNEIENCMKSSKFANKFYSCWLSGNYCSFRYIVAHRYLRVHANAHPLSF